MLHKLKTSLCDWYNQPINPLFLELRDERLQSLFQAEAQKTAMRRFTFVTAVLTFYITIYLISQRENIKDSVLSVVMIVPFVAQTAIGVILSIKWKRVIEFLPASIMLARIAICIWAINLVQADDAQGASFWMQDTVVMIALPIQICCSSRARIDMLFTIPFSLVSNMIIMDKSLADTG